MNAINPDFELIKKYLNEPCVNEIYFEAQFTNLIENPKYGLSLISKLINENCYNDDNIYFFWCYYYDTFLYADWSKEVELYKIWNLYNKNIKELKEVLSIAEAQYMPLMGVEKPNLLINSISFELIDSRGIPKTTTIKSHPLNLDLLRLLIPKVKEYKDVQVDEKNVKTYLKNAILSTKPFFNYLKAFHFKDKSNNKTYEFIGNIINTIGVNLDVIYPNTPTYEVIKQAYKAGKK